MAFQKKECKVSLKYSLSYLTKNPYIVKFYEASLDQDMTYLGIVSDYLDKQYDYPMQERAIWKVIQDVSLKSIHLDLSSIIIVSSQESSWEIAIIKSVLKLNKFYFRRDEYSFYLHKQNYTDSYLLAPEFIRTQTYDYKADIWMMGYMLYQMMFKDPLLVANNVDALQKKVLKGIHITYNPNYSLNLNNLLKLMLCYDPELRPNIEQISNYCQQAQGSQEEINLNRILPKFKTDKLVLYKKRIEKDTSRFRILSLFPSFQSEEVEPAIQIKITYLPSDLQYAQQTMYSLQLPKVLNYQISRLNIKDNLDMLQTKTHIQSKSIENLIKIQKALGKRHKGRLIINSYFTIESIE